MPDTAGEERLKEALKTEVISLQRALEEINAKISGTRTQNSKLTRENEDLSAYIDSLMERVRDMGGLITADRGSIGLRLPRSMLGRSRRSYKVNAHVGELQTKPVDVRACQSSSGARSLAAGTMWQQTAPMTAVSPGAGAMAAPLQLNVPLQLASSGTAESSSAPSIRSLTVPTVSNAVPPPPPPPPLPERDPATGRYGVGVIPPPPPHP